jgi:hypothetical protein
VAVLGVLVATQIAAATHPRPRGAMPLRVPLVPAYKQCTSPNSQHQGSIPGPSCIPPVQESNYLTVGTPDANGAPANSIGFERVKVAPTSDPNVLITASITDVRCRPGTDASVCSSPNAADGPDYSGQVQFNGTFRLTDHYNGPNLNEAATAQDIPFPVTANCVNTSDTSTGGVCTASTECPLWPFPCSGIPSGQRAVIELGQVEVFDGGRNGVAGAQDSTVFMRQGIFIP